ncbi:hypothetical protein [Jeotgalibacillus proteolyticus]|uniref:Uncharacterized protein n=1 Tax=Jeotgalibacillus proteolyticus TaxID=2082395 RepID=A0A2S5GAN9_9BACL|nr:hypothetical protein [Jeotgalibacillus proteolyticus]PPA69981.1 hypothetical protein C4B60_10290 [Jeotgalibacillus proteolyticus]
MNDYYREELRKFLFSIGVKADLIHAVLAEAGKEEKRFERQELFQNVINSAENLPSTVKNAEDLSYAEDRELFAEMLSLPFENRTAIVLFHFFNFKEKEVRQLLSWTVEESPVEASEHLLAKNLEKQLGFVIGRAELRRLVKFINQEVEKVKWKIPDDPLPSPVPEKKEKSHTGKNKRNLLIFAAVFCVLFVPILLLNFPGDRDEEAEGSVTLESELQELDEKILQNVERLSEETGLTREELERTQFAGYYLGIHSSIHQEANRAETEEEIAAVFSQINLLSVLRENEIQTPMEQLISSRDQLEAETEAEIRMNADQALEAFLSYSDGMKEIYEEKLKELEPELSQLKGKEIAEFSFSDEASQLISKIEANGFQVMVNPSNQTFQLSPGGTTFEEMTEGIMTFSYLNLLKEMNNFPYIQNSETAYSYAEITDKLLDTDGILRGLHYGTRLSDDLLSQNYELLRFLVNGTADHPIHQEGKLRDEVREAWETLTSDEFEVDWSNSASYVAMLYREYEKNNFEVSEEIYELKARLTAPPAAFGMRAELTVFPLESHLRSRYNMYSAFQDDRDLSVLTPIEIAALYINALIENNHELSYMLMAKTENHPSETEWGGKDLLQVIDMGYENIISMNVIQANGKGEGRTWIVRMTHSDGIKKNFIIKNENHVWKVIFEERHVSGEWGF